ncbi:hypothetical protein ACI78T_01045 [Blastococcus sp. SYSU D00922]
MLRWSSAVVLATLLTAAAVLLVTGDHALDGPVVWRPDYGHGIRAGEIAVFCGWVVGMTATATLLLRRRRDPAVEVPPEP